jgi:hypothetical protein
MREWRSRLSTENKLTGGAHGAYETRDADASNLLHFAVGLALTLVVVWAGMWWLLKYFDRTQNLGPPATPFGMLEESNRPPLPRLQVHPVEDLKEVHGQQNGELESYGWVDRTHGIVHIPVQRAMDLILERGGLPVRPSGAIPASHQAAPPAAAGSSGTP